LTLSACEFDMPEASDQPAASSGTARVGSLVAAAEHLDMYGSQQNIVLPSIQELTSRIADNNDVPRQIPRWTPQLLPSYQATQVTHYKYGQPMTIHHQQPPPHPTTNTTITPTVITNRNPAPRPSAPVYYPTSVGHISSAGIQQEHGNQAYYGANSDFQAGSPPLGGARRTRENLPKPVTQALKQWLFAHASNPYPTDTEKRELCDRLRLSHAQVNNWFINARRRYLKKIVVSTNEMIAPGLDIGAEQNVVEDGNDAEIGVTWVVAPTSHVVGFEARSNSSGDEPPLDPT
jgi:hypothetical protein